MDTIIYLVFSLINSIITYLILGRFLVIKPILIRKIALFLACQLVTSMIIYIGDIANMPPTFIIFLLALQWACDGPFKKKLTIGLTFSTAPFALNCLFDSFLFFNKNQIIETVSSLIIRLVFWILLYYFVTRFDIPKDFDLPSKYWNILIMISCIPFLVLLTMVVVPDMAEYELKTIQLTFMIILVIVVLSVIGILYAIAALYKASQLEEQQVLSELNEKYYKNVEAQMNQIRLFRHDLNNHLQVLSNMPENQMKEYVNQLMSEKSISKPISFCRNSVINALLSSKYDYIENNGFGFSYDISLEEDPKLSATDLCALVGNLLDNAIEGAMKLDSNRRIALNISCEKGLFIIRISNSSVDEVDITQTSKDNSDQHGFGLKSIREIVARKNGTLEIKCDSGLFEAFIVIPNN